MYYKTSKLSSSDLNKIHVIKIYPLNWQARLVPTLPDKHLKIFQEYFNLMCVVSDLYIFDDGLLEKVPKKVLESFDGFSESREPLLHEIQLTASLLFDISKGTAFTEECSELVKYLGASRILDSMGCNDPGSVSASSCQRLLKAASEEIDKVVKGSGILPTNSREFVVDCLFWNSTDSTDCDFTKEAAADREADRLRVNPSNPRCLQIRFVGDKEFHSVSLDTLWKFLKKDRSLVLFLRLLGKANQDGYPVPVGSRDPEIGQHEARTKKENEELYSCLRDCIVQSSIGSPCGKVRMKKHIKPGMSSVSRVNESLEENVKTAHISREVKEEDIPKGYDDIFDYVLNEDKVFLAFFKPVDSATRHSILIDPFGGGAIRSRGYSNGIIFDPADGFGIYPRCRKSLKDLKCTNFSAVHILHRFELNDDNRKKLQELYPNECWGSS